MLSSITKSYTQLGCSIVLFWSFLGCNGDTSIDPSSQPPVYQPVPSSIGIIGDPADVNVTTTAGTVLMGGGPDVDNAMKWMIEKSKGGDVVIIRASGSTGYNSYLYDLVKENGIRQVNSVETLLINNSELANNPKVAERIKEAEMLFIAGGDQANYVRYWKNTPIEEAINYLIKVKKVPVGGTSAGCAIMGEAFFTAENNTITSLEALTNPYNNNLTLGKSDFIDNPYLKNTITDTHYNNPDRKGRHITFLARLVKDNNWIEPKGIGVMEETAVCINENGLATVFGKGYAYFLKASATAPEVCIKDTKLTWNNDKKAILSYTIEGGSTGNGSFNLAQWKEISGGNFENFYVIDGVLSKS